MALPDSIVVAEEWISEHYLTTSANSGSFTGRVVALRRTWDAEEEAGHASVRSRLRENATAIARAANELLAGTTERADEQAVRDLHALIRRSLGYSVETTTVVANQAGGELRIPDAVAIESGTGLALVIVQAQPAVNVEDILDNDGSGLLLTAATFDGKQQSSVSKVVSALFLSDRPPPYVLVQAGRWVLLAERSRWPEGRWLAVDIGLVAERRDLKKAGELETAAAMLGRDTVLPRSDGSTLWQEIFDESVQHTVGVSKDLREGIRLSVEIIANEVVSRRRSRGMPVDGINGLARDLTRQSLRFLYRILFVLYAETSAELGVLPVKDPQYRAGYGVDRLRDLTLTQLTTDRSRRGTHLYESLHQLFALIDKGHSSAESYSSGADLEFRSLQADLFASSATALIDEVGLGNQAMQQVLGHLLLSKAKRGSDRGFISYAELGINQLGAVYEGLMSYTGSFAAEDQYEVAPDGNPEKGTWVLPASRVDDIDPTHLVKYRDPETGEPRPVLHRRGTFVYRLAGRERQQSASYYTPEVLTRSVVSHSLAELLDRNDQRTPALDILTMTVCEPALGSGAFAIEAVRQLAAEYLKRRQVDLKETIPAEQYPEELQKVKAYLALHQVYGVDLNDTAVELAEVSLWLDTMYAGLQAPWFGLHLRRGNSLIGSRHAFYSTANDLPKRAWLKTAPQDIALSDGVDVTGKIHHFLLPAEGWGAGAETAEARTYAPAARERLRGWRSAIRVVPSKADQKRLGSLARRVETLWQLTLRRMTIAESEIRRHVEVWRAEDELPEATGAVTRQQVEAVLQNPDGAYLRLRRIMDAWCALWFWPVTERVDPLTGKEILPPSWEDWLGALESIVGVEGRTPGPNISADQIRVDSHSSWEDLDQAEALDLGFHGAQPSAQTSERFGWLRVSDEIAAQQGFFHWELDFAPVFAGGGFDLQVGNPPWVRPMWDETASLAEDDPWWQITDKPAEAVKNARRARSLAIAGAQNRYLDERIAIAGLSEHLGSDVDRPVLAGLQPDLYRCFMERTWRSMNRTGIVGLIHPESHFTEARAGGLRRATYPRLRRHWQFRNELKLFTEIDHSAVPFGVHIYGHALLSVEFLQASSLYSPQTVDRSFGHNGSGTAPGVKDSIGNWDLRPHRERIVRVDGDALAAWAALIDEVGTPPLEARMLYPVNLASAKVLDKLAAAPRIADLDFEWSSGWHETSDRKRGYFVGRSGVADSWSDVILQGPHLSVATPLFKQPNETMRNNLDTDEIDLEQIGADFIPRTSYQRAVPIAEFTAASGNWKQAPSTSFFRLAWREMGQSANMRTLHSALLPPGPTHVHAVNSLMLGNEHRSLVWVAGMSHSIVADFMIKVIGSAHVKASTWPTLPYVPNHALEPQLILRTLRLNSLIREYAPLWEELFTPAWKADSWVPGIGAPYPSRPALGDVTQDWTTATPLRRDADRRQALVEIDAIVAVMLNITADELATIYRTQFPVLQSYERDALYDNNGRQVPREIAKAYRKNFADGGEPLTADRRSDDKRTYDLPFTKVDREPDLRAAHAHFAALSNAQVGATLNEAEAAESAGFA